MSVSRFGAVFTATMTSGATTTGEIQLGSNWNNVYLEIPSLSSNAEHYINAAGDSGGTYRRVYHPSLNSSTVGTNRFAIASSVTNALVPIPNGLKFIKVETSATVGSTTAHTYRVFCAD